MSQQKIKESSLRETKLCHVERGCVQPNSASFVQGRFRVEPGMTVVANVRCFGQGIRKAPEAFRIESAASRRNGGGCRNLEQPGFCVCKNAPSLLKLLVFVRKQVHCFQEIPENSSFSI